MVIVVCAIQMFEAEIKIVLKITKGNFVILQAITI